MANNTIKFKEPFSEQYTLFIDSDIKGVNVHMTSTSQMRWDFSVLKSDDLKSEVRLILLDHMLLDSNNPLIKEIANLTKAFSRLYNELHLKINENGKITEVVNMDLILSKWKQTKNEMEEIAASNPDIKNAIILNDNLFQDQKKLKEGIENSEFFLMYFNKIFGKNIPSSYSQIGLNYFNSANVDWKYHLKNIGNPLLSDNEVIVEILGEPSLLSIESIGFKNRAYIQFANQIDVKNLNPILQEKGKYRVDRNTGRIIEASILREEIADEELLYTKMKYTFYNEEMLKYKMSNESITNSK